LVLFPFSVSKIQMSYMKCQIKKIKSDGRKDSKFGQ
jgi:hypothetical protein